MKIAELCNRIDIPEMVREKLIRYESEIDFAEIEAEITGMNNLDTWEEEKEKLTAFLAPDEDGLKMLTCQLHEVCNRYKAYGEMGIFLKNSILIMLMRI